jgi:hypothetical protein
MATMSRFPSSKSRSFLRLSWLMIRSKSVVQVVGSLISRGITASNS